MIYDHLNVFHFLSRITLKESLSETSLVHLSLYLLA